MAFTSRLGTSNSYLSNIFFGQADTSTSASYNNTLTIDGISAVTIAILGSYHPSLAVDCTAAVTVSHSAKFQSTLTVDGFAALDVKLPFILTLSVAGISAITLLPGQQYFNFAAIEGISDITRLVGFGHFDTLSVDGVSDLTVDQLAFTLLTLSIDGISDISESSLQNGSISLTVSGISALTVAPNFSYVLSFLLPGVSAIYEGSSLNAGGTDGLYNFVALTSNDTIAVSTDRQTPVTENPSAIGGVAVDCSGVFNRTVVQVLALTHSAALKKPTEIIDSLHSMFQTVVVQRVRSNTVTQTITYTQDVQGYRAFSQSLTFTDQAVCQRVKSLTVTQSLVLVQAVSRKTVIGRTLTQTLVMGQNRLIKTPIIGTINNSNPTGFQYTQPIAQAILVPKRCLVVIGVPTQTVILPCPQFDDTQARQSSLNLKRTMTGDTFTYVRKTDLQKLKYTFQMGTYKAAELYEFLLNHCHEVITLVNHKGETWYVNLTNNPFEFAAMERWQSKGERHDITLEFEGVQL